MSDDVYSVANGPLQVDVIETLFDYSLTAGVRKIARFSYENRANNFYSGNEQSYSDAATIGKVKAEPCSKDLSRQQGVQFLNQDYFLRYEAITGLQRLSTCKMGLLTSALRGIAEAG